MTRTVRQHTRLDTHALTKSKPRSEGRRRTSDLQLQRNACLNQVETVLWRWNARRETQTPSPQARLKQPEGALLIQAVRPSEPSRLDAVKCHSANSVQSTTLSRSRLGLWLLKRGPNPAKVSLHHSDSDTRKVGQDLRHTSKPLPINLSCVKY